MIRKVNTDSTVLDLTRTYEQNIRRNKPRGLWYDLNDEWISWINRDKDREYLRQNSIMELEIDLTKMLILETPEQLTELHSKYKSEYFPGLEGLNWNDLVKDYAGIEIQNYRKIKKDIRSLYDTGTFYYEWSENLWFILWDVSSGCIWDLSIIKSYKHIQ